YSIIDLHDAKRPDDIHYIEATLRRSRHGAIPPRLLPNLPMGVGQARVAPIAKMFLFVRLQDGL
ncbi:MAG TPA: hypothetical protein VKB78_11085, partial [Pirellulales bacterium]|nr:hypothetical protein [Pirellulales bacterium]